MKVLDLFSGIGGFSLGLERAGMTTVAFCEIDDYCRRVLKRHWPDVPVFGDVRELTADVLADALGQGQLQQEGCEPDVRRRAGDGGVEVSDAAGQQVGTAGQPRLDGSVVEVICGGFPCQDISCAGRGAGLAGARSGLWREYARLVGELRPRYVIVENVAALLGRGLSEVLGDLAALGYDAQWHCIPAAAVGAPHRRDRIWIIACRADADETRRADVEGQPAAAGAHGDRGLAARLAYGLGRGHDQWLVEPDVGRVADGVPHRVDRLRALGNAVVPQIPELIGRAIMAQAA